VRAVTLEPLAERLGHRFADERLLRRAMAHRSWVAETTGTASNERLEFLGDAVLGWVVADIAYRRFGDLPEGALTDLRKSVVNAIALAEVAVELGIGEFLLLGRGEDAAGGRTKSSILSDAFEAVLGAVYVERSSQRLGQLDHKTNLQELAARLGMTSPGYVVRSEGPDHAKQFFASAVVDGRVAGEGIGRSKKAAEQAAAAAAYDALAGESLAGG
jgi:ribonuclease-3